MISIDHLPMGAILLAPDYVIPQLRKEILERQKGMIGVRIFSLHNWLSTYDDVELPSIYQILYEYKTRVISIKEACIAYKEVIENPIFLKECYQFLDALYYWNIPISNLPQTTPAYKELYNILQILDGFPTPSHKILRSIQKLKLLDVSKLYILDTFSTVEEQKIIDILYKQGAKNLQVPLYDNVKKQFFHTVNKRQEIEACAQFIIKHDLQAEDIQITLANASYKPILAQIFARYEIPFTILQTSSTSIITKRFITLFEYYLYPDSEHLFACIDTNLFNIEDLSKLREYIEIFACDIFQSFQHVRCIQETGHILDTIEVDKLKRLEEQAESIRLKLIDIVHELVYPSSYKELIEYIVSLIQLTMSTDPDEKSVFLNIGDILKDVYPYIHTREDINFFLPFIEDIAAAKQTKTLHGVLISDLQQTCVDKKHHFILGCTQKDYPAFQVKKGIFDENYVAHILGYPTMEERYQFYLSQLERTLYTCEYLYISFPLGTYEGKGLEASLEIEQFIGAPSVPYPLQMNYEKIRDSVSLSKALAERLYVRDGHIYGSISALERYVKCPLSYFLRYGLSLREPIKQGFPNSYAGTLFHYILETLVEMYGKTYTRCTTEMIENLIQEEINVMQMMYPAMQMKLANIKARVLVSISQTLQMLDDFEQHSMLKPMKETCEYPFLYSIPLTDEIQLSLRGFIDRIDQSDAYACIIDYKSSSKTLSETTVFAALQLQLLTYSIVVKKELKKDVLGAYYLSLKNENINYAAGKLSRRKPVTYIPSSKAEYEDIRYKAHRLQGWTMHRDIAALDDNGAHIVGVSQNKEGEIKARKLYDLQTIERYFITMYQTIGKRILEGDICCTPTEDACMFCAYHEICRFKGVYAEKAVYIEPDDSLYQTLGGKEDA